MRKFTKGILAGLCAVVGLSAIAVVPAVSAPVDVETAYAETTYTTKDVAMMGRVAGWHGNGNFEVRLTLGESDWAGESGQKDFVIKDGVDLPTLLKNMDFFNKIEVGGKTLAEWGCTTCYGNIYWLNESEPDYTIQIPLSMGAENMATASAAGVGGGSLLTILEGALIPSNAYLQGDTTATVYRAGCDFVTTASDVAYGVMSVGKTEVESIQYVTGWDSTYNNAYFGVSLKGDDYVGNGTQTEVNQNNYQSSTFTTNRFPNKIVVDGEAGKAEGYGLFNLGEKGKGYFSFVFRAMEEETESIFIPAGTLFPSFAMTTLHTVNGNPVYIMYETQTDVTFIKNNEGVFVNATDYAGVTADKLDTYKAGLFREAEETQRLQIIATAKVAISSAVDKAAIDQAYASATAQIDALKTAAQYADEELAAVKSAAVTELEGYKADGDYFEEQSAERLAAINAGKEAVANAVSEETIAAAVTTAKGAVDSVQTKAQVIASAKATLDSYKSEEGYFKAEEEAQRVTIVAEAKVAIDNATTQTAVNAAVNAAKSAIDMLMAASEYYEAQDVAMLGRVAGWHGNGNFEIRITLGEKDWTADGEYTYAGELAQLLNKLGFFNHIKLGEKTLAEWGCTACYANSYWLGNGGPQNTIMIPLSMGKDNMTAASAAGIKADYPITLLEGALIPGYTYLNKTGSVVYRAGCDYETITSTKAYGIEATAKTEIEGVKYVQGFDGTCGYFGISFVGDDYLGDGTQLDVNQNYYFDNKFSDLILVNGEAGKVGYYGLFNLGEKGKGYYAFQMFAAEEDIVSITIPAGTKFPTRAMTTLFAVNNNPVYIMYEVEETITLYKSENGYVSYDALCLSKVENYKVGLFREAEEAQRQAIVAQAVIDLKGATTVEAKDEIVANAWAAIDALKTAGQYADEENAALLEAKNNALAELEGYKANEEYFEEQVAERAAIIEAAKTAMNDVSDESGIAPVIATAKAAIDELVLKSNVVAAAKETLDNYKAEEGYFREEQAAERATIIAEAKVAIDNATTETAVKEAVANAKAAIDKLMAASEYYETKDVAMLGRVAGWHGNGNFEIRITLGEKDWTADGEYAYAGELAQLLNKLDFFNKIKLGEKTLAEWGCTACYANSYWLGNGGPQNTIMIPLSMGKDNMTAASAAGIKADYPITILEGALIPGYNYLNKTGSVVYRAGSDYETIESTKAYGIEATAKTEIESVKYVQGFDGKCGYLGISFVGDDYLGDGTQLDVNQNYYFDNKFSDLILVNGEAGKVGYYGLFNLGENGTGYYAFQVFVAEEDIVSITIPAGTKFPTRAMTTLFAVNSNPVYIMYEVAEEITLYKTENGYVTYAEYVLSDLEGYKAGLFREAEEVQRLAIIAEAKSAVDVAEGEAAIDAAIAEAKSAIDALKTAAQYADEELASDKQTAVETIDAYKADVVYLEEQAQLKANAVETAKASVAAAATVEEINAAVEVAKAAIDVLLTKAEIVADAIALVEDYKADVVYFDEQAAEKAAVIEAAKALIEGAISQVAIMESVDSAKEAIDAIKTKAEMEADTLNAQKAEANAKVDALKKAIDFDLYDDEAITTINGLYSTVKAAITSATTEAEINSAVATFESALAEVPQKDADNNSGDGDSVSSDVTSEPETSEPETSSGEQELGCFGATSGLVGGVLAFATAVVTLFRRRKED